MIRIEQGDITKLAVDAIVNAANQVMLGVRHRERLPLGCFPVHLDRGVRLSHP